MKKSGQRREGLSQIKYSNVIFTPTSLLCILECHNFYPFLNFRAVLLKQGLFYITCTCASILLIPLFIHINKVQATLLLHIVLEYNV